MPTRKIILYKVMAVNRTRLFLLFALIFQLSASAQNASVPQRETDSILNAISELVYNSEYVKARKEATHYLQHSESDQRFTFALYSILGDIEVATGNRKKGLYYFRKVGAILEKNPEFRPRKCLLAWKYANLYYEAGRFDSAYYYARYAIDSSKANMPGKYETMREMNLPIIGYHYFLQGDYKRAEENYAEALAIGKRRHEEAESGNVYLKMADAMARQSNYKGAVAAANTAFVLAERNGVTLQKLAAVNKLIDLQRQSGNYREVARCLQLKMDLMDAIQLAEQKKSLKELEAKFKVELKDRENASLKAINRKQQRENGFLFAIIVLSVSAVIAVLIFAIVFGAQKRRIARQKGDVERLNRLNQQIFTVISHDFKGPMMGLDLLLEMQEKYKLDAERFTRQSNQLRSDLKQAGLILENLLSWSKAELGMNDLHQRECVPAETAKAVIAQLDAILCLKNLEVSCELRDDLRISVSSDSFTIILRNLLSNAVKYSREGGTIRIGCDERTCEFCVGDDGVGMDETRRKELFTRQLDSRLGTQRETGYGIGLNLVYELVRKNNGTIRVESAEGEGTKVYFSFGNRKAHE